MTTSSAGTVTEDRALSLLGSGVSAEATANALGVSASRISQLLADKRFADQVAALRYEALQEHNSRDSKYDSLEDKLLSKLEKALPLMFRPGDILKSIQIINGAKRRGVNSPTDSATVQNNVVNILLPTQVLQKFATNAKNQVVKAGDQDLLTMQSSSLLAQVEAPTQEPQEIQADDPDNSQEIKELKALNI